MPNYPVVTLKKNEDRRIRMGHLWIFSNEVDTRATSLQSFTAGEQVVVEDHRNQFLAHAYINPHSLICSRVLNRSERPFDQTLFLKRLNNALQLRESLYQQPYYRWVFGESDLLPGLVIDRYGDICVVQITTAGMECWLDQLVELIASLIKPTTILLRNDSAARKFEGIPLYVKTIQGMSSEAIHIFEGSNRFIAPFQNGQKTGWFYDQRDNRQMMIPRYVNNRSVLDLFSYAGGWGISAALAGASRVCCVDQSQSAVDYVNKNAELNQLQDRVTAVKAVVLDFLTEMRKDKQRFDVIVLDPPAFIKNKKHYRQGLAAYRHINQLAIELLEDNGILISCSCSHHLPRSELIRQVQLAASKQGRQTQVLQNGYQSSDHPIHAAIPETEYLKVVVFRIHRP
ncbi:MAG: class I SAM-dependent rRNA methyltransferase [Methylococcales bacterium]